MAKFLRDFSLIHRSGSYLTDLAALHVQEEDEYQFENRRVASGFKDTSTSTDSSVIKQHVKGPVEDSVLLNKMLGTEYLGNFFEIMNAHTESSDIHKTAVFELKANGATLVMNASLNATESAFVPELFYRHSMTMTAVYCIAYLLVFAVGLVGNFFVIAVVFRSPRMRTVTNFFIVNLAVADILVIVFSLPATLMSNIFVRKYSYLF